MDFLQALLQGIGERPLPMRSSCGACAELLAGSFRLDQLLDSPLVFIMIRFRTELAGKGFDELSGQSPFLRFERSGLRRLRAG